MAKLDLEWLSVFDEIYKTASVSRAAERLGMAQASASIALNKLRLHFGDRLFSRTALGMQPTPFATEIHPELRDGLATLERTRAPRARFDPATAAREFTVCLTDISELVLMPTLLNRLRQTAPQISIVTEKISSESPQHLATPHVRRIVCGRKTRKETGWRNVLNLGNGKREKSLQLFVESSVA